MAKFAAGLVVLYADSIICIIERIQGPEMLLTESDDEARQQLTRRQQEE